MVFHHEEPIDRWGEGWDVVEAAGVAGGAGVGVHCDLIVGIDPMDCCRHLRNEPGETALVRAARTFEVEVDAIEVLSLDRRDQRGRQRGRSARR